MWRSRDTKKESKESFYGNERATTCARRATRRTATTTCIPAPAELPLSADIPNPARGQKNLICRVLPRPCTVLLNRNLSRPRRFFAVLAWRWLSLSLSTSSFLFFRTALRVFIFLSLLPLVSVSRFPIRYALFCLWTIRRNENWNRLAIWGGSVVI